MRTPVDRDAIRSLFRRKKELFGLVYEFNLLPANYIHESWIKSFISTILLKKITESKRGREILSQWILAQNNLNQDYYYNFTDPLLRLALLPSEMMNKISLYCGIALNHKNITGIIDKRKREKIVESIGQDGYQFGIKIAPLLVGNRTNPVSLSIKGGFKKHLEKCGATYLLYGFSRAPRPLFKRLTLKLPKDISFNQNLSSQSKKNNYNLLLFKKILKYGINPEWHHLFL